MGSEDVLRIVEEYAGKPGGLIGILQEIQARYGYLPPDTLGLVAEETGRSLTDVYGVATFYRSFRLKPRGKHFCSVCLGTACHVRGGPVIAEEFGRTLGISPGETTISREFSLETVNCLGACALGPIVVVDGHYFSKVSPIKVKEILEKSRKGLEDVDLASDHRIFPVEVSCPRCNHSLMDPAHQVDGQPSISVTAAFGGEHFRLRLSSLYGSFHLQSERQVPADATVDFFCPHCHAHLTGGSNCLECGAPMVPMIVRGGGVVQVCSRRGCRGHILDLSGSMP